MSQEIRKHQIQHVADQAADEIRYWKESSDRNREENNELRKELERTKAALGKALDVVDNLLNWAISNRGSKHAFITCRTVEGTGDECLRKCQELLMAEAILADPTGATALAEWQRMEEAAQGRCCCSLIFPSEEVLDWLRMKTSMKEEFSAQCARRLLVFLETVRDNPSPAPIIEKERQAREAAEEERNMLRVANAGLENRAETAEAREKVLRKALNKLACDLDYGGITVHFARQALAAAPEAK